MPRVIQLLKAREAVEVVETAHRSPLRGEVSLRIEACALGQLDWNLLTLDAPPRLPLVPGHEAVGVVEAVAPGGKLRVGERVLVTPLAASGVTSTRSPTRSWPPGPTTSTTPTAS